MALTRACFVALLAFTLFAGEVPRKAAPLEFTALDGRKVSLEQLRGKVVAVMFFSTDCPHCQQTTQVLNPIYEELKPRGLEILGLAINPSAATNLKQFAAKFGPKFPLGLSMSSECNRFAEESVMQRFTVPYIFFVDRNGMVREEHPGADRKFWHDQTVNLRSSIEALLKEPAKAPSS